MEGAPDDTEHVIYCASRVFHEYRKIWLPKFGQKLYIKRDKINLFDPYAIVKSKRKLKVLLSSDTFLGKYPNFVNIS